MSGPPTVFTLAVVMIVPIAGFLLGFLDFVWIKFVPFPFAELGNSTATWAVAAFLLTYYRRWRLPAAVGGAIVCLVVAVPSYYLAAALIQHDNWSNLYDTNALIWMAFGVPAGVVFGGGGALARTPGRLRQPATALPGAVLFAEAALEAGRIGSPDYRTAELVETAVLLAVLGVLITLAVARSRRDRGTALLWAIPLTAAGWLLLTAVGFR
jgi:hypothetical protein